MKADGADVWRLIAVVCAALALGAVTMAVYTRITQNKTAIEKSCILLNNAILQGQAQAAKPGSSTNVLVESIVGHMTGAERQSYRQALTREAKGPPQGVQPVDCEKVADDPDKIKATPQP